MIKIALIAGIIIIIVIAVWGACTAIKAYCRRVKRSYKQAPTEAARMYGAPTYAQWLAKQAFYVRWCAPDPDPDVG